MKELYRKIKNFMYRGVHGWCPEDTWNLDEYLARVISETTNHLAKNTCSFPPNLTPKAWKKILNNISKDMIIDYDSDNFSLLKKRDEALKLFVKYFNSLWD